MLLAAQAPAQHICAAPQHMRSWYTTSLCQLKNGTLYASVLTLCWHLPCRHHTCNPIPGALTCLSHSASLLATFCSESSCLTDSRAMTSASTLPSGLRGLTASDRAPASARWYTLPAGAHQQDCTSCMVQRCRLSLQERCLADDAGCAWLVELSLGHTETARPSRATGHNTMYKSVYYTCGMPLDYG
jgi:hypothetical protein